MKNLPTSIDSLAKLLRNDCVYVDKTDHAYELIQQPGAYFLSRPRRFGKSLFVDTLKEIFEGNRELFEGLFIYDRWDWERRFPVITIDFASGALQSRKQLDSRVAKILRENSERLGIPWDDQSDLPGHLADLIRGSAEKYDEPAVVLVDEYDKPILDNIDRPQVAGEMREGVKNIYSVLKEQDANLRFVFMTGVSKFSKVSPFSGVNQLRDITISRHFATICGYTEQDLRTCFGEHLAGVDWDELRQSYNGYSWRGETVYNPYDVLLFLEEGQEYAPYWFATGSPSFLIKLFKKNRYFLPKLKNLEVTEEILNSFDIERISPIALLFQTGYLTIERTFRQIQRNFFALRTPNMEVNMALNDQLINAYTDLQDEKTDIQRSIYACLERGDLDGLVGIIKRLFASIPYRNFTGNDLPDTEGYYASVMFAFFSSLNAEIIPEDVTLQGQADMTVKLGDHIYVMEFKVTDTEEVEGNPALDQIREMDYAAKYRGEPGRTVHEVGLIFSRPQRNLVKADWDSGR